MMSTQAANDRVCELTWALIDEMADDDQIRELEQLLLDNAEARHTYVMCVQMHVDLRCLFGDGPSCTLPFDLELSKKPTERRKHQQPSAALSQRCDRKAA